MIAFHPPEPHSYDVVIYGGTSSGVIAAVQAARMGRSVLLIEPSRHVGGMTTSGLGLSDMGATRTIGGLAREFYHRVWLHYCNPTAWICGTREQFLPTMSNHWGVDGAEMERIRAQFLFEPHVAQAILDGMLCEAGVHVAFEQAIDLEQGVRRGGERIAAIRTESGKEYEGRFFIDASYEGDLMARAGVSYTIGREDNSRYGETFNGMRPVHTLPVSAYRVPDDPGSGLLEDVEPVPPGMPGAGDHRVQAYNFRLCLTDVPENRVLIEPPPGYDPALYELHARYYSTLGQGRPGRHRYGFFGLFGDNIDGVIQFSRLPNRKTDSNNSGFASTDYVGHSHTWAEASHAQRRRIWQAHQEYMQGLLYFAGTDPRIPAAVREELSRWGLARDEFADNGHWPHQLYVREARRMLGEYVITEHDTTGATRAGDGVALASYPADSHYVTYYADGGQVACEGGFWDDRTRPFPISYRAIRPPAGGCENLLVAGAVSASHVAFASLRMEPVFMMLGQAAATAAVLCLDSGCSVQKLDVGCLQRQLARDAAILEVPTT